jgi:hypothetical protein
VPWKELADYRGAAIVTDANGEPYLVEANLRLRVVDEAVLEGLFEWNGTLTGGAPWDALHSTGEPITISIDDRKSSFFIDNGDLTSRVVEIVGSGPAPFGPVEDA